jgi:HEAT repeat protein
MLLALLDDKDLKYEVPWSLGQIGDRRAIAPLIQTLADSDPTMRVFPIAALRTLGAKEALPALHGLLNDNGVSRIGKRVTVADAARAAIADLESRSTVRAECPRRPLARPPRADEVGNGHTSLALAK